MVTKGAELYKQKAEITKQIERTQRLREEKLKFKNLLPSVRRLDADEKFGLVMLEKKE